MLSCEKRSVGECRLYFGISFAPNNSFWHGRTKETILERAAFLAGWSELSWFGPTQPVLA